MVDPDITPIQEDSVINFNPDGTFTIETIDETLLGYHELRISAFLMNNPTTTTLAVTILPLEFIRCQVEMP